MALFRQRRVTFACVWTRAANAAAVRLYERAGFRRTEQMVLTWLPLEPTVPDGGTKPTALE
jgi:hypothetical protein